MNYWTQYDIKYNIYTSLLEEYKGLIKDFKGKEETIKIFNRRIRKIKKKLSQCRAKLLYEIKPKREINDEELTRLNALATSFDCNSKKFH